MIQGNAFNIIFNTLTDFAFNFIDIFQNAANGAVFGQQFGRGFCTDTRYATDAIRRITHQG
ncbi:hypothetical protein SDC9_179132 [bioreactor metagenome]|uniref:Uncharacterized protein n=1 Tax=bioreactor metagenome TaxID=1076179 RepID=A0A645GY49_9ZZZZ